MHTSLDYETEHPIPDGIPETIADTISKGIADRTPALTTKNIPDAKIPDKTPDKIPDKIPVSIPDKRPDRTAKLRPSETTLSYAELPW